MQQSTLVTEHRRPRSANSRVRLILLPVAIVGAVAAALLALGGNGGDVVSVSSSGVFSENQWLIPVSELPIAAGEIHLEDLREVGRAAGPLHQKISGRGVDDTGAEVLVSGYWWRVSESDDWTSSGVLAESIERSGITYILRQIPTMHETAAPTDLEMIWYVDYANESWQTESFSLDYDGIDGSRLSVELSSHNGGTMLKDAANQPNVTVTQLTPD